MTQTALTSAALGCTAAGLAVLVVVSLAGRRLLVGLRCALDLWLAAGLLRLAGEPSWATIGGAAAIVAVRQLVARGLSPEPTTAT